MLEAGSAAPNATRLLSRGGARYEAAPVQGTLALGAISRSCPLAWSFKGRLNRSAPGRVSFPTSQSECLRSSPWPGGASAFRLPVGSRRAPGLRGLDAVQRGRVLSNKPSSCAGLSRCPHSFPSPAGPQGVPNCNTAGGSPKPGRSEGATSGLQTLSRGHDYGCSLPFSSAQCSRNFRKKKGNIAKDKEM